MRDVTSAVEARQAAFLAAPGKQRQRESEAATRSAEALEAGGDLEDAARAADYDDAVDDEVVHACPPPRLVTSANALFSTNTSLVMNCAARRNDAGAEKRRNGRWRRDRDVDVFRLL